MSSNSPTSETPRATVRNTIPRPSPNGNPNSVAAQYARAKALHDARDAKEKEKVRGIMEEAGLGGKKKTVVERFNERKRGRFAREWIWVVGFFCWVL